MQAASISIPNFSGDIQADQTSRIAYATDASAYREIPLMIVFPKTEADLEALVRYASEHQLGLIPRTAGTSLAGQVVGSGIVVDVSRYMNNILELDVDKRTVRVQPGVVRDELNNFLRPHGLVFGPETSTSNRAMIGGMVGNNSCGSNSIRYGSTRDHLKSLRMVLSDGHTAVFDACSLNEKLENTSEDSREHQIYKYLSDTLDKHRVSEIEREYPHPDIPRRNTGYAIDLLARMQPFTADGPELNLAKLVAGSEGSLGIMSEIELELNPLPPAFSGLMCIHCESIDEALKATNIAVMHQPWACELIDHFILECTENSLAQKANRFFIEGQPQAILIVELKEDSKEALESEMQRLEENLRSKNKGYHFPILYGEEQTAVWSLRKAGLGLLSNIPGDKKPVPVIEDTAVRVADLPAYIEEFNQELAKRGMQCVHYAHAGSGELHLRPIIDLKSSEGQDEFKEIAWTIARLVKKYKGSLSGEHGDGRLRGEFIPFMVGESNYQYLKELKESWDPQNLFNPSKIVNTPSMNTSLRYEKGQIDMSVTTAFDWHSTGGFQQAAEMCNGSADCRTSNEFDGVMCPTFKATGDERQSTRARANLVRESLTQLKENAWKDPSVNEVLATCLSCKGCKKECPSSVDLAKIKAEFAHQNHLVNGASFKDKMIADSTAAYHRLKIFAPIINGITGTQFFRKVIQPQLGFHPSRTLPPMHSKTWLERMNEEANVTVDEADVLLFVDEFTNYMEPELGLNAQKLLGRIGLKVALVGNLESGRSHLSKGFLDKAKYIAIHNVTALHKQTKGKTLVGIEPSSILTFRDEYIDLCEGQTKLDAIALAKQVMTFDEYLASLIDQGKLEPAMFKKEKKLVLYHSHCHQKALSSEVHTARILKLADGHDVRRINSGCCGMAGSFGMEKEHYELSMKIGETRLFPTLRNAQNAAVVASGTSCRQQIKDGVDREAIHLIDFLLDALV